MSDVVEAISRQRGEGLHLPAGRPARGGGIPCKGIASILSFALLASACAPLTTFLQGSGDEVGQPATPAAASRITIQAGETVEQAFRRLGRVDQSIYIVIEGGATRLTGESAPIGNLAEMTAYLKAYGHEVAVSVKEAPYIRIVVSDSRVSAPLAHGPASGLHAEAGSKEVTYAAWTSARPLPATPAETSVKARARLDAVEGDSLRQTLEQWARQNDWRISYEVRDWQLGSDASFGSDLKTAVNELFATLNQQLGTDRHLFGEFHDRNRLLRVTYAAPDAVQFTRSTDRLYLPVVQATCAPLSSTTVAQVSFKDRSFAEVMDSLLAGTRYTWSAKGSVPKVRISAASVNGTLAQVLPQLLDQTNSPYSVKDCEVIIGK